MHVTAHSLYNRMYKTFKTACGISLMILLLVSGELWLAQWLAQAFKKDLYGGTALANSRRQDELQSCKLGGSGNDQLDVSN